MKILIKCGLTFFGRHGDANKDFSPGARDTRNATGDDNSMFLGGKTQK